MPDKRITDLAPLAGADLAADVDVLAIADVSAGETKKIKATDVVAGSINNLPPGSINGDVIIDGTIEGDKLEENTITDRELAPDSVGTIHLKDQAVTTAKITDLAVTSQKLADGAVVTDKIADLAVTNDKLAGDIEGGKLQENAITARELATDSVTADALADGAVDTNAIQDGAVTTDKLANGGVTTDKLADDAVTTDKLASGAVDTDAIQDGSVTSDKLAGPIGLDKLPDAPPNTVLAGTNSGATGPAAFGPLVGPDLPVATSAARGAVVVPVIAASLSRAPVRSASTTLWCLALDLLSATTSTAWSLAAGTCNQTICLLVQTQALAASKRVMASRSLLMARSASH